MAKQEINRALVRSNISLRGYVYAITNCISYAYKIGLTNKDDISERIAKINRWAGVLDEYKIAYVVPIYGNPRECETWIHSQLNKYRLNPYRTLYGTEGFGIRFIDKRDAVDLERARNEFCIFDDKVKLIFEALNYATNDIISAASEEIIEAVSINEPSVGHAEPSVGDAEPSVDEEQNQADESDENTKGLSMTYHAIYQRKRQADPVKKAHDAEKRRIRYAKKKEADSTASV
jgi:hypothetical protein